MYDASGDVGELLSSSPHSDGSEWRIVRANQIIAETGNDVTIIGKTLVWVSLLYRVGNGRGS